MTLAVVSAFAQGTVVFKNDVSAITSPPDRLVRFGAASVAGVQGLAPSTQNAAWADGLAVMSNGVLSTIRVQLFYGAAGAADSSLIAVSTAPTSFRGSTSTSVGSWFGGTRTLTGFDTATPNTKLQVRVWDSALASDWATAQSGIIAGTYSGLAGESLSFAYSIPTSATPAPSESNMNNFAGFNLAFFAVPEPSSMALAGLAAAGLLIFRRRK